ncbi:hypothetical protein BY996DRAFT_8450081 [Phakopsora pachyrhizi]|nr:hypothetical protein BY996DRAFT_8450081 [Phakopsora pachyrhizi]
MRGEPEDHNRVRRKDEWPHSEEKTKRTSEAPASGRDRVPDHNDKRNIEEWLAGGLEEVESMEVKAEQELQWGSCPSNRQGAKGGSEEQGRMDSLEVNQEEEEMVKEELVLKPRRRQSQFRESNQSRILNLRQRTGQMAELAAVGEFWRWSELFKAIDGVEDVFRPTHKGISMVDDGWR